uniref:Serpentine receptor class gamma n=1 Tax=Strongyloides papillosus TaxID=174720 RepID=A0A0N5C5H3_STREA
MVDVILAVDIIQLLYKIPSMLLMMLSIYVIIKEIKNKNNHFNKQFYTIIVCKLTNEIFYIITIFTFIKLPKWGFYNDFLENNNWTATIFYVLLAQQTTFMFLITLLISVNRYIAIKYPLSYQIYFSKSKILLTLLTFIILSTIIGVGNILFNARYKKVDLFVYIVPAFKFKNEVYYQHFYKIFLFGIISIATCTFNVMAILILKKHNLIANNYKRELYYIIYSVFIFITLFTVEAFFVFRLIHMIYQTKLFFYISNFLHVVAFDSTTIGDFYFLIYSCRELRKALKTTFGCSKKFNNKVSIKIPYRRIWINFLSLKMILIRFSEFYSNNAKDSFQVQYSPIITYFNQ